MAKNHKSNDVIEMISKKITLKRELRSAKENQDQETIQNISKKITKVEEKLSSRPLQKT